MNIYLKLTDFIDFICLQIEEFKFYTFTYMYLEQ